MCYARNTQNQIQIDNNGVCGQDLTNKVFVPLR